MKLRKIRFTRFIFLSLFFFFYLFSTDTVPKAMAADITPAITENQSNNSYGMSRYDYYNDVIDSYLVANNDDTLTRVEYDEPHNTILLENYTSDFKMISKSSLQMELTAFGGFYSGREYNWFVFGQENPEQSDSKEVFRIVKYTKDWKRVGSCSMNGANTYIPFKSGCLRMAEYNGYLYIRTSHTMYGEKVHHQANVTIEVKEDTMMITDSTYWVSNISTGYVSHSFDQFIDTTDGILTGLDLGDYYPRSIVLTKYAMPAGEDIFNWGVDHIDILPITMADTSNDSYAYNATGVSIGGYQVTNSSYLVAYSSVNQNSAANQVSDTAVRNIYISSLNRSAEFDESNLVNKQITNYKTDKAKTPHLVKVSNSSYLLLWEYKNKVNYVFLNSEGSVQGNINSHEGSLSECVPIINNGKVTWYTSSEASGVCYYQIDAMGNFKVSKSINYMTATISPSSYTYGGTEKKPMVSIPGLNLGTDFVIKYSSNVNVGKASVTISGIGNYSGVITKTFSIIPKDIKDGITSSISTNAYSYTGAAIKPPVTVKYGSKILLNGVDYTVEYFDNIQAGSASVFIKGKGNYTGSTEVTYQIQPRSIIGWDTVLSTTNYLYDGKAKTPSVTVKNSNKTLIKGTDYTVSYTKNINAGTATVSVVGRGNYAGTIAQTFRISPKPISEFNMVVSINSYTYTGKTFTPSVTIKNGSHALVKGIDYSIVYKNNIKPAIASVTINGKGNYTGSITKNYIINPASPKATVSSGSKYALIKWSKVVGVTGYEIYMSTSKNGTYTKQKSISSSDTSYKKTGLTKGKTYYYKVRGYTKTGNKILYGGYSAIVSVKVK